MITRISLLFVDQIVSAKKNTLKASTQMIYLNCVIRHLRGLEPSRQWAEEGFYTDFTEFGGLDGWTLKYKGHFEKLEACGLVQLKPTRIYFPPLWGPYFEDEGYIKPSTFAASSGTKVDWDSKESVRAWVAEKRQWILENQMLYEAIAMSNRITRDRYEALVGIFLADQAGFKKEYANESDISRHFSFWVPSNIQRASEKKKGAALLGESKTIL